jgi:hypothetical protein
MSKLMRHQSEELIQCPVQVEDLTKKREPCPLVAVYFIMPSSASVTKLIEDFNGAPLYPSAHVFFSSKVSRGEAWRERPAKRPPKQALPG